MDWASEHLNFVVAAYALSLLTLCVMAWRIFSRRKSLQSQLMRIEHGQES